MLRTSLVLALLVTAASPVSADPPASTDKAPAHQTRCFFSSEFDGWKAADDKTLYIKVRSNRYYRLDLAGSCPRLTWPGAFLITKIHGSSTMCTALDWDLHVATDWHDIPEPCIVKTMTELTPEEAAALPAKVKP